MRNGVHLRAGWMRRALASMMRRVSLTERECAELGEGKPSAPSQASVPAPKARRYDGAAPRSRSALMADDGARLVAGKRVDHVDQAGELDRKAGFLARFAQG